MIICGIELAASEARLVILDGEKDDYSVVRVSPPKIILADDTNQGEVKAFKEAMYAFIRENHIEKIAIKKRGKVGKFAGGPVSFKLEGLIQLYPDCLVVLVAPATISAAKRKYETIAPQNINKYQHDAFYTAFTELN